MRASFPFSYVVICPSGRLVTLEYPNVPGFSWLPLDKVNTYKQKKKKIKKKKSEKGEEEGSKGRKEWEKVKGNERK